MREQCVDLAAIECNEHFAEARIAGHDLERPAFVRFQHARRDCVLGARIERPDHDRGARALEIGNRGDAGAPVDPQCVGGAAGAANVGEAREVVVDPLLRHHVAEQKAAASGHAEREAIGGRHIVEMVGEDDAAGALHIARHDAGLAWNVLRKEACKHPHLAVDSATGRKAGNDIDRLAREDIISGLRRLRRRKRQT